jgi:enterochelin esterase-like enzyme
MTEEFDFNEQYKLGVDSYPKAGVAEGRVTPLKIAKSSIFPDCHHAAWLYLPANYDGRQRLALMVFLDGRGFMEPEWAFRVPNVMNNLIDDGRLRPMAALFLQPGVADYAHGLSEEQRSFEYDSVNSVFSSFLIDEILPQLALHANISANPDDRGIGGNSSGGICAFTIAWHRPDAFRRVLSLNGSFVDIRGGGVYPELIRQQDTKPIKIFLQEGVRDGLGGKFSGLDWVAGNRAMARALAAKSYDFQFVMGEGSHDVRHAASILPEALRWLWAGTITR